MTASASIVERLRDIAPDQDDMPATFAVMHEAATIISDLQAEVEKWAAQALKEDDCRKDWQARALTAESSRDAAVEAAYEDAARIALETPMGMENHPQKIAAAIRSRAQTAREDGVGK